MDQTLIDILNSRYSITSVYGVEALEQFGRDNRLVLYVHSEVFPGSVSRHVNWSTLIEWLQGENRPSFLKDFEGWWLSISVFYRLVSTKYYVMDLNGRGWRWRMEDVMLHDPWPTNQLFSNAPPGYWPANNLATSGINYCVRPRTGVYLCD